MCWITYDKKYKDFKVAEEDIPVFKVVRKIPLSSYYTNYLYILNEVHTTEPIKINHSLIYHGEEWKIQKGFHSYSVECTTEISCGQNIQVYSSDDDAILLDYYKMSNTCKLECLIPKGSLYYVNEWGEYVSESILPFKTENW